MTEPARALYSLLLRLLLPAYLLRLLWRGRREPPYRQHLGERFGFYKRPPGAGWLWVHAVSLGETRAAAALVVCLRRERPGLRLLITHTTATGREAGRVLVEEGDRQVWLPYDTPGACRRFFAQHRPSIGVLMETEVWPNLLAAADAQGVPMVLANARLSEKSLRQAQRFDSLLRPAAVRLTTVLAQTQADAQRLEQAGARTVSVVGNLKFDMTPDATLLTRGQAWRARHGAPIVLAASTREGEEAALLTAWRAQAAPRPRLLIVPRHPQRFDEIAALVEGAGFTLARRSAWSVDGPSTEQAAADVWLGDSMGEMPLYFGCADVALLGGSFERLGGQNLIEAAACACPVVMGPHTFNFAEAAELAEAAGAALRVADLTAGVAAALDLCREPARRASIAGLASDFAAAHRGAALRIAHELLRRVDQQMYRAALQRGQAQHGAAR